MFVAAKKLTNLTVIIDRNNIQIDGPTELVMPLDDLAAKWTAFGWHVIEIDGHNLEAIIAACDLARAIVERPVAIIAHTIAGKGVEYMEYDFHWHGNPPGIADVPGAPPKADQARVALHDLRTLSGRIRSEHQ
jgi:transketolase